MAPGETSAPLGNHGSDGAGPAAVTGPDLDPRSPVVEARRLVIKIGTNVLCRNDGELALGRVYALVEEIVDARRNGREVILVSSGSIALGMKQLRLAERPVALVDKQACAAVGQSRLMDLYQDAFDRLGVTAAQVLLTEDDFADRARYLNLRNTFSRLLELGAVPIVNENDTVSTSEIETRLEPGTSTVFGDNDVLSALVASKLGADLLVILSDVDGLHDAPPESRPGSRRIPIVETITPELEALAKGGSTRGRGGMRTKLRAARVAVRSGTKVVIARGARPGVLRSVLAGEDVGTLFLPGKRLSSRKRWIAFATTVAGRVHVNEGARDALVDRRASLLFAGISRLEEEFARGEIVSILDQQGHEFARGIVNYSSDEARRLVGRKTDEIVALLRDQGGDGQPTEFILRDNIVILGP